MGFVVPIVGILLLAGCSVSPFDVLNDDQRVDLRNSSSEYQQQVLADLYVDEAEYRQSVDDWRQCVVEAGADPTEIVANGNNLSFSYSIERDTEAQVATISVQADSCLAEYHEAIGRVWVSQGTELN
ncbi:hypothetical protein AB4Y63_12400 [Leifsonia sp. YAF41]|uniref:hypothetical protein n=1 Tax=Leifsonia sp. YAF41 TaxID=3233086 RepID=UPI003F999696